MKNSLLKLYGALFVGLFAIVSSYGQVGILTDTLYVPGQSDPTPGAMYPRVICLEHQPKGGNGVLLATFEHYIPGMRSFPIYRSADNGKSWTLLTRVEDTYLKVGNKYQPVLYELPQKAGDNPAGTILLSGNAIPASNASTELVLYKSTDGAKTWEFVSSIVKGGRATTRNESPVWEPFLNLDKKGNLVCFYSDEGSKAVGYNQLLCHKVSPDGGKTWGDVVLDVAIPDKTTRPGMVTIAQLPDGRFLMTYEVVGIRNNPVYFRYSLDGDNWGDYKDLGTRIVDSKGNFMSGTPYVIWTPVGGKNGTLIATSKSERRDSAAVGNGFMINRNLGQGPWTFVPSDIKYDAGRQSGGYSQAMGLMNKGKSMCHMVPVPYQGNKSKIVYTIYDLNKLLKSAPAGK